MTKPSYKPDIDHGIVSDYPDPGGRDFEEVRRVSDRHDSDSAQSSTSPAIGGKQSS